MIVAALALGLVAFVAVLRTLEAQRVSMEVIGTAQRAVSVIVDPDLSDDEKEATVRRASLRLFLGFFHIGGIALAAFAMSTLVVLAGVAAGLYTLDAALARAASWPFILGSTAFAVLLWIALDRLASRANPPRPAGREEVPYSALDMALHNFAFASLERQRKLASLETALFRRRIDLDRAARPVFVTSLPRAGTTILLETLAQHPDFASATYRHMPFTLAPLLWGGFSDAFRKSGAKAERAHGDGIEVGFDSPEAFEEMVWMAFWADHYGADRIRPWSSDDRDPAFEEFLRAHMAKIVATKPGARRYLSKNNANIARLPLLETVFPDASIVIPLRNPAAQVQSLLRQHRRFTDLHAREPFARQYMEGIGHLEFGSALRPIDFGGPLETTMADRAGYWLRYWIQSYERVRSTAGSRAVLVDQDALCASPEWGLTRLGEALGLDDPATLAANAGAVRPPRPAPRLRDVPEALMARAASLHAELCERAINHEPATRQELRA